MEEKSPGLLLHSIPYLGQKKILKVFTPEYGLITLLSKSPKLPSSPFCIAEWVYRPHSSIYPLKDATLLDPLLHLRTDYTLLTAAGAIAQDLLRTQLPGKKAPDLYQLACLYLQKLPASPHLLAASFRLKLLLHEGLLSPEPEPTFTSPEWAQASTLAFSRTLSPILALQTAPFDKIRSLFDQRTT